MTLVLTPDDLESAACRDQPTEIFFPFNEHGAAAWAIGKAVCAPCPVRVLCLEEALRRVPTDDFGVWGGTTPTERQKIRWALSRRQYVPELEAG